MNNIKSNDKKRERTKNTANIKQNKQPKKNDKRKT